MDPHAASEALYDAVRGALAITGAAEWESGEVPGTREMLTFYPSDPEFGGPAWACERVNAATDDYLPVSVELAGRLIAAHFRAWLLERGWEVQASVIRGRARWRLVDCVSIADGGGDRLDADYPRGEDELAVVCASVRVVASSAKPAR